MIKRALCIGINEYCGLTPGLGGCVNDANDWADYLDERGYTVMCLVDEQATLVGIQLALADLIGGCIKGDKVVLTYSGFGSLKLQSGSKSSRLQPVWCPWDTLLGRVLALEEIEVKLEGREAGVRVFIISDTCHSIRRTHSNNNELVGEGRTRSLSPATWQNQIGHTPSLKCASCNEKTALGDLLVTACRQGQFAWEGDFNSRPNGVFSYYALKTLRSDQLRHSYNSWFKRISPSVLPSAKWHQSPCLIGEAAVRNRVAFF